METLKAWEPYKFALRCFYKLHNLNSPGDFEDWDIYWLSGLTATRAIWDTLKRELEKTSALENNIWENYNKGPAKWKVHQSFTKAQRHQTLHEWVWDIIAIEVSSHKWIGGEFLGTSRDLVFRYPTAIDNAEGVDEELQGEDPIRLLGIALNFQHENLCLIESALEQKIHNPFDIKNMHQLYCDSPFFDSAPNYYR